MLFSKTQVNVKSNQNSDYNKQRYYVSGTNNIFSIIKLLICSLQQKKI